MDSCSKYYVITKYEIITYGMQNNFQVGDLVLIKDTGFFGLEQGGLAGQTGIVVKIY